MAWHRLLALGWVLTGAQASVIRTNGSRHLVSDLPIFVNSHPWHLDANRTASAAYEQESTLLNYWSHGPDDGADIGRHRPKISQAGTGTQAAPTQRPAELARTAYYKADGATRAPYRNLTASPPRAEAPSLSDLLPARPSLTWPPSIHGRPSLSLPDLIRAFVPAKTWSPTAAAAAAAAAAMDGHDIFAEPIDTKAPPATIASRADHPVPRKGIRSQAPLQTNKFYANFFLGDQLGPAYTFPYSLQWAGGKGATGSWGMSCSHVEAHQRVFGKERFDGSSSFYINPIGIQSMVISAAELGNQTALTVDSVTAFSARVHLSKDAQSAPAVSFPLVQGMSCVTAQFDGAVPVLRSGVSFSTVTRVTREPKANVAKYNFKLADGTTWRVYGWRSRGDDLDLTVVNDGRAEARRPFFGAVQVCKDPQTAQSEALLDDGAGVWPVTVGLSGSAAGAAGTYRFRFQRAGHAAGELYMYALPHHVGSFDAATRQRVQAGAALQSTTKGLATLVRGAEWTMVEPEMPVGMGFAPWHPERGSVEALSEAARAAVRAAAARELAQNMAAQANTDSMYFSGKALAKFAAVVWVAGRMVGDAALAQAGLAQLKAAFGIFAANRQRYPLTYESAWGGVVSRASYDTGDAGVDFGNTYYNDHHFHYGYHILAAATIGALDPAWAAANADYVNTLARDVANPSARDGFFPMWRSFDWYHGHSWAHGLYASMDGKNQESSSEDMMHAYALKMWGKVVGNADLEARGNLQLAIIARSLRDYYLYEKDNTVQPKQFIGNKVAGILFENKVDHTTFFDPNIEAIQGIHMIPILPPTAFVRRPRFVREEWETYFSRGRVDEIGNAWKGIIYASYATVDPKAAWEFFTSRAFLPQWLDGGASLTWFMAYSAALGGL